MRFIIGLVLGGYFVGAASLLVKLFSKKYRGRLEALNASTFALSLLVIGGLGSTLSNISGHLLLWVGAVPPIVIAVIMMLVLVNDRKIIGYSEHKEPDVAFEQKVSVTKVKASHIFDKKYRKLTINCIVISGLNLSAYQFFAAYLTTYLKTSGVVPLPIIGIIIMAQGIGSLIGGLFWGVIADKFGRKYPLIGFILAAVFVLLFFIVPPTITIFVVGAYGFTVSCSYTWGIYFAELYPAHLRSMGAALYNGGRIISLFTPYIIIFIIDDAGLRTSMMAALLILVLVAFLWSRLPETLDKDTIIIQNRSYALTA